MTQLATTTQPAPVAHRIQPVIDLVCNAVTSQHTRRAYSRALVDFMAWIIQSGQTGITKAVVAAHVTSLRSSGVSASSINQRLTAIRKLAHELADAGVIDHSTAQAISRVDGVRVEGRRLGNWLTQQAAQSLLDAPDLSTIKGARDRAILAVLLGCGLRREECAGLTVEHIQQRDGRWVIVDLVGKRNKRRSVPVPAWAKASIDRWTVAAGITTGPLFRNLRRGGHVQPSSMSAWAVFDVVRTHAAAIGLDNIRPHDLRRTFAKLADKGAAPLKQIQLTLGHESVATTERYLGTEQNLTHAPCDVIALR